MSTAYFDAHNHWQDSSFDADRAGITSLLQTLNIRRMVVNGTTENDWPRVQALAANDPSITPSFGLHPWFTAERTSDWARSLKQILISEIGPA